MRGGKMEKKKDSRRRAQHTRLRAAYIIIIITSVLFLSAVHERDARARVSHNIETIAREPSQN